MGMRKVILVITILLVGFSGDCFGQVIQPDTLTIYGTFPVYGREAEWMEDQLNIWKPDLDYIHRKNDFDLEKKGITVLQCHDVRFTHNNKASEYPDHLFFDLYVKCMSDSCTIYMTNIDVICNHKPGRYIHRMSTYDDALNRSGAWLRKNRVLADSARVYSLSLFHELKGSLEQHLNRPLEVRLRRVK